MFRELLDFLHSTDEADIGFVGLVGGVVFFEAEEFVGRDRESEGEASDHVVEEADAACFVGGDSFAGEPNDICELSLREAAFNSEALDSRADEGGDIESGRRWGRILSGLRHRYGVYNGG